MTEIHETELSPAQFFKKYRLFFAFVAVLLVCVVSTWFYLEKVLIPERNFSIKSVVSNDESTSSLQ